MEENAIPSIAGSIFIICLETGPSLYIELFNINALPSALVSDYLGVTKSISGIADCYIISILDAMNNNFNRCLNQPCALISFVTNISLEKIN